MDKYGVPISQWIWLYQALLGVSMKKKTLWINVCAGDWTAETAIIASNIPQFSKFQKKSIHTTKYWTKKLVTSWLSTGDNKNFFQNFTL